MLAQQSEYFGAAVEQLEGISRDEHDKQMMKQFQAGMAVGEEIGEAKKAKQVAERLKQIGMTDEQIWKIVSP